MKHKYTVGQEVKLLHVQKIDREWGCKIGDVFTISHIDDKGVDTKSHRYFYFYQIEPLKVGGPRKTTAVKKPKPKAEPKVSGYFVTVPRPGLLTIEEAKKAVIDLGTEFHIYEISKEYELITTSELKEVRRNK